MLYTCVCDSVISTKTRRRADTLITVALGRASRLTSCCHPAGDPERIQAQGVSGACGARLHRLPLHVAILPAAPVAGAMPLMFNATVLNGMGVIGEHFQLLWTLHHHLSDLLICNVMLLMFSVQATMLKGVGSLVGTSSFLSRHLPVDDLKASTRA